MTKDDEAILRFAKATDPKEREMLLDGLFSRLQKILIPVIAGVCWEESDVEDVVQETILKLVLRSDQVVHVRNPTAWLITVAKNLAHNVNRSRARRRKTIDSMEDFDSKLASGLDSPESPFSEDERRRIGTMRRAMDLLGSRSRELLMLKLAEKSNSDIAEICGLTQNSVATSLTRARKELREAFLKLESNE